MFAVTLSAASGQTVTVDYATANGTATAPADYITTSGPLRSRRAPPADDHRSRVGDMLDEPNETCGQPLQRGERTIADRQGVGTITDDDAAPLSLSISNATVTEGNSGTVNADFTVYALERPATRRHRQLRHRRRHGHAPAATTRPLPAR